MQNLISISPCEYLLTQLKGQWHTSFVQIPVPSDNKKTWVTFFYIFGNQQKVFTFIYFVENVRVYLDIYSSIPDAEQYESHSSLQRFS